MLQDIESYQISKRLQIRWLNIYFIYYFKFNSSIDLLLFSFTTIFLTYAHTSNTYNFRFEHSLFLLILNLSTYLFSFTIVPFYFLCYRSISYFHSLHIRNLLADIYYNFISYNRLHIKTRFKSIYWIYILIIIKLVYSIHTNKLMIGFWFG